MNQPRGGETDPSRGAAEQSDDSFVEEVVFGPTSPRPHEGALADVPWTLRDVAWATVLFGLIFGISAAVLAAARTARVPLFPEDSRYLGGVLLLILESALIIPVWLFATRKYNVGWSKLGLRGFNWLTGCGLATLLLMGSFMVNAVWAGLLALFDLRVQPDILPVFGSGAAGLVIALAAAGVVAPLVEEIFFRGFLLPALLQRYGFWTAALINGLVFALIHFMPTAMVPLFVLGVLLCVLYWITRSIWPSILMHATMNTLAVFAAYAVETGLVPAPGSQ